MKQSSNWVQINPQTCLRGRHSAAVLGSLCQTRSLIRQTCLGGRHPAAVLGSLCQTRSLIRQTCLGGRHPAAVLGSLCQTRSLIRAIAMLQCCNLFIADIRNSGDHQSAENQSRIFPWVCKRSPGKKVAPVISINTPGS